jgi:uncharacterized membrane protein YcaP (DUF421 family)
MEPIIHGAVVYIFLLVIFRLAGTRMLSQMTSFDLILLLIISETTQQAMVDNDHSITNCFLLVMTLVGATVVLSFVKMKFPKLERWLDDAPLIIVDHGKMNSEYMKKVHVDKSDVLEAARLLHGLERLDQIKYAVVERSGEISIIPSDQKQR